MSDYQQGLLAGLVAGILGAGVLGFVLQQLRLNRNRMAAHRRPQAVVLHTDESPLEVVGESIDGCVSFFFWISVLVVLGLALWALRNHLL